MTIQKIFIFLLLVLINPPLYASSVDETVTIQFKWFHQFQFAGYYAAKEKGFYAEEGLKVVLKERNPNKGYIQSVLDRDADYGVADAGLLLDRMKGKPVVLLKQIFQHSPLVFITLKNSGITTPDDMEGKSLMLDSADNSQAPLLAMLHKSLGTLNKINTVQQSFTNNDLILGKIDALAVYLTSRPYILKKQGIPINIINPQNYGVDFYGDNFFTTAEEIENHPKRVEKMIRATIRGWKYALTHPQEIIDLIIKKYNPKLDHDLLSYEAKMTALMIMPEIVPLGSVFTQRYEQIAETYQNTGLADPSVDWSDFIYNASGYGKKKKVISLSHKERLWLAEHKEVTLGFTSQVEPLLIVDDNNDRSGILIDIYKELEKLTGIKINIELDTWSSTLKKAKNREVDGFLVAPPSLAESIGLLNTNSLTVATPTVFAKNNAMLEIYSEADLRGKKIAVLKDIYVVQQAIAPYRDEIDIVETDSALNMMKMVYEGKVDAAFGLSYHYYLIGKHMFIGIKPVYFSPEFKTNATASIRPEWPEFISIINKGLEAIGKGKLNAINQRWSQLQVKEKYVPTKTEKAWLATHKNIRLGVDPQWAPFEFFDATKVYSGIASAYVKIINETLDINMYPLKGFSWSEVVEKTKTGEIDVLPCAMQSTKRSKFLNFTKPYISSSLVVLTHDKTPFISDLHELSGKTIAVIKGYITEDILKNDFPNHKFIQVNNIEEALLRVSEGSIDAFIGNLASITYVTERLGITNLKVAGTTPYKLELAFAVRKDWPELVGILDRLISSIPDNDKKNIHSSWVNVRVERQKNWRQVGIIIGTISFIMTVIIFWNRRLAKEIEGRKQAQSLTNRYEFIVNSVKDMMTFIDNDLNYLAVNDTWCTTMQIERENVIGENIATTWEEETFIDKIKPNMDRCFAGERVSFLIWQNTPSHGVRHFKVMLYPFKNTEGVTTNIVTVNRDVTEQTMAENALRESEQLFKRTFDQAPVGAAIVDLNGHFEKVNAKFCQIMGYSANELLDFTIFDITHPNDRQIEEKNVSSLLSGNIEQYQNDTRYTRKDGQTVWGRLSLRMVADINGKPLYFLPMIEDITDQKQAVNEYRKLSQAIEQSQVSVVLTDLEGIMEYVNPKFCELTGYSSEEAIGKNPRILNSGKQSREFYKDLWDTIKNGKTWQGELTNKKKTGELYWEKAIISPVRDENNQVTHFVAVKENITNIKRINMALKERITELAETKRSMLKIMKDLKEARHTAEEATRAKSHFLANMSHEIRTPMNAILGLVHLALQTKLNSKQEDYLVKVDRSAHSLLGIINDILDFSKIEAGKLTLEKTEFNLQEVLDDITNIIDLRAQEKGVELIFLIDPKTPTTIIGDPLRLYQVLINLTNNALKFTDNGEIVIEISPGSIIDKRVTLLFAVRDTGIGISRIDQKRLFQSFNQADSSVTRKYGGTGLGLSISKKLIEMMHGTIKVKSQKGHGSTFSFSAIFDLPIAEPSPRVMPKDLIGLRTLVIDDNQTACQSLATALQSFSFRVTTSFSGAEALDELEKASNENDPYNLVLVDWQMPEMDSLETCRQIQENTSLSVNPAIIMVTAYGREEVVQRIGELGIENYIFKPVSYSILFDAVLEVFGKETLLAETRDKNIIVTSPSIDIAGAHILLAEDNKINQQVARELLERWKLLVDIANNGQEAVKMANENSYDLILMDIQMPKLDGIAATQEIRTSLSKNNHIPIVAMTAHAMVGDREKSLEAGMNDHINKPINPDELYNCIISMISLKDIAKHTDSNPKKDDTYSKLQTNRTLETKPINFPANIPGFDLKSGLMRVAGNKKLYLDILLEFQEEHEHFSDRIAEALDNNDNLSALSITHSLKGVSGNLGMNELHEKAIKLENGLKKQSATIKDLLDDTLNTLQATLTQINKIVPHNKESTINEVPDEIIDFDLIIPKITELRQLLELNDMASGKKFLEIKDSLLQQDPNNLSLLEKAINSLDFQQALAIVNKIEV